MAQNQTRKLTQHAFQLIGAIVLLGGWTGCSPAAFAAAPAVPEKAAPAALTAEEALRRLAEGNRRFQSGRPRPRDLAAEVKATSAGQHPFAVVLGCMDSRVPPEIVFDQGIGDIFSVRVAGNVVDDDVLGSLEYATKKAGARLIVVLGHTRCGAVEGACQGARLDHLSGLLDKIRPAVSAASASGAAKEPASPAFVDAVAEQNVRQSVALILERSGVVRDLVRDGRVAVRGAVYEVSTGLVRFLK